MFQFEKNNSVFSIWPTRDYLFCLLSTIQFSQYCFPHHALLCPAYLDGLGVFCCTKIPSSLLFALFIIYYPSICFDAQTVPDLPHIEFLQADFYAVLKSPLTFFSTPYYFFFSSHNKAFLLIVVLK